MHPHGEPRPGFSVRLQGVKENTKEDRLDTPRPLVAHQLAAAGFSHGFFTRSGGVSTHSYASLNCSYSVGDTREHVDENLRRVAAHFNLVPEQLAFASQVHGQRVVVVDQNTDLRALRREPADALLSLSPGVALAVRTADCVPILIGELDTGAALAIHAGWRGLCGGVIEAGLGALRDIVGSSPQLLACVGPYIHQPAFEVSDEVAEQLVAVSHPGVVARSALGRPHVDLGEVAKSKLVSMGLARENIHDIDCCTQENRAHFFSYRRDGSASGRHIHVILCGRPNPGSKNRSS